MEQVGYDPTPSDFQSAAMTTSATAPYSIILLFQYIISHPANCQLLRHNDNASKNRECDIEIEDLIEKIEKWNQKYGEYPNTIDYKIFENSNLTFKKFNDLVKK